MKRLILAAFLILCSVPSWATWALVQNATNAACTTNSSTCAITVSATGSGHVIIVSALISNTSDKISSVSDGGSTYSLCPTSECYGTDSSLVRGSDFAYTLSSVSGKTTITVTRSSATTNAWLCRALEYSFTSGPAVYDKGGSRDQSTNSASPAGVTLSLTGSNDVIVQSIGGSSPTAISGSYTNPATFDGTHNAGWGGWINTNSGTAPTWTQTNGKAVLSSIAIKESSVTVVARPRGSVF